MKGHATMRKEYILENLDCPTCAAKIERTVAAIDGVDSCTVSFLTTKMVVEAAEDKIPAIEKAARKQIRRIEPDTNLVAC